MRRQHMSKRSSKSVFSRNAATTHKKNITDRPMRGGIRL